MKVLATVLPGLALPCSAAEGIFGSHGGAASAAPEYYSHRIEYKLDHYVRPSNILRILFVYRCIFVLFQIYDIIQLSPEIEAFLYTTVFA